MLAQIRAQPRVGLPDAVTAALARAMQEQDDRNTGGRRGLQPGRNEHLVVGGLAVHFDCAGFEATTRAVRQRGTTGHHQQGQQRQPARHGTDHGNSWGGGNASIVVRCRQRGIMRRVTAGAGNWR
ncbi:hypothetical protein G6F68_013991 [Rhizopus microsporus]|nr:hypothetical protein G6F68_013991 [Rhizopus microsporus]